MMSYNQTTYKTFWQGFYDKREASLVREIISNVSC
jgi:hypothetical protein